MPHTDNSDDGSTRRYIERDAAVRAFQRRRRAGRPPGTGKPIAVSLPASRPGRPGPQAVDKGKFDARLRELDELIAEQEAHSPQRHGREDAGEEEGES